jgi:HEAT repeat protein
VVNESEEWEAVRSALLSAGVDPTDLGRFVNRPNPALPGFEPEQFDARRALPVLNDWLPRVNSRAVRETLARRIAQAGKKSDSARVILDAYRGAPAWALADALARTMTRDEHDEVVELAADTGAGRERQMLVYALWRVKTERARSVLLTSLTDPDVARHAITALRRAVGNEEARAHLELLQDHPNDAVRNAARDGLKRIRRAR